MHISFEDGKNGWCGIHIGIDPGEIDRLINRLNRIKADCNQHFHISSDYQGTGGVGDIEIAIRDANEEHNAKLLGCVLGPGESVELDS
jgi:hypothetical protein